MSEPATEIDVKAIQQRYSQAWNGHDPDAIAALHTEDTRFCTHGAGPAAEGREAMRTTAAETFAQFPEFPPSRSGPSSAPITGSSNGRCPMRTSPSTCVDVIALEDGLVKSKDTYFDFAQLQAAMATLAAS